MKSYRDVLVGSANTPVVSSVVTTKECLAYTNWYGCWRESNECPYYHAPLFKFTQPVTVYRIMYLATRHAVSPADPGVVVTTQDGVVFNVESFTRYQMSLHDIHNSLGQNWWTRDYLCGGADCIFWGEHGWDIMPYMLQLKANMDKFILINELSSIDICTNIKQQLVMLLGFYPMLFVRPS